MITTKVEDNINFGNIKDNDSSVGGTGTQLAKIGSIIYSVVTNIGVVVSVVVIAFLGIKYMMGSAEERAEYKKSMMPYLIGAILVFGASGITQLVIGVMQ